MNDRRTNDRTRVSHLVKMSIEDGQEMDAELADHSTEGARLIQDRPVKIGSMVRLTIGADRFNGSVKYCTRDEARGKYIVGILLT